MDTARTVQTRITTLLLASIAPLVHASNEHRMHLSMHDVVESAEKLTNGIKHTLHDAEEFVAHELHDIVHNSVLAGNILPVLNKLVITPEKAKLIAKNVMLVTQWQDLVLIGLLGWGTVPLLRYPYESILERTNTDGTTARPPFQKTLTYHVAEMLSQVAKIAVLVYLVDIVKIVLVCMGFTFPHILEIPQAFAKVAYAAWIARKIAMYKKHMLKEVILRGEPDKLGRVKVVNRLLNAFIVAVVLVFVLDVLSVELGFAGKSVFAFGSVGTVVVSLASQGIATQLLNGLLLSASDRIYEGDSVRFGNGISGTVVKMGWTETILRQPDDSKLTVPNSDLASQQVSNLSRIHRSQVKQTLRFQYEDVDKIPALVEDIKKELRDSCPMLIVDGTRPFRVHWTSYRDDHLEVEVNAHFLIKPIGDLYHDNRQQVLLAINRAVKKNNLSFAIASD